MAMIGRHGCSIKADYGSYVYDDGFGSVVGSMFKILYNWYASFRMKNRKINLLFIFLTRIEN